MENVFEGLKPEGFFRFFKEISDVPRSPGNEKDIADYLVKFAKGRKLKYYIDSIYNVIIWKEASLGYEQKEILALQSHVDMICEKEADTKHDFLKDPLKLYIDGDFVKAKGTTLGADNGVGVAYMLTILDSGDIKAPKLECIFTVQEETTMNGARQIDENKILSKRIISFDNFREDQMWISSATSKEWISKVEAEYESIPEDFETYELSLTGFPGGHSGLDIWDEKRGNPIKIAMDLLKNIGEIQINEMRGGSRVNIIPREFYVKFSAKDVKLDIAKIKEAYEEANISLAKVERAKRGLRKNVSEKILGFINEFRNGVIARDDEGNVVLSANMGAVDMKENECIMKYSLRSNKKELGEKLESDILAFMKKYDVLNVEFDEMKGYESKGESKLAEACSNTYFETYGKDIKKINVQACLECGFFAEKIENLEYISIAPDIYNAHSPNEMFSISSVERFWQYIVNILKSIK